MGFIGSKKEGGESPERARGHAGKRADGNEREAEARIGGRTIEVEILSKDDGRKSDSNTTYDDSPRAGIGCLESLLTFLLVVTAFGFPIYLVVMAFAGGRVPVLGIEFEGSLGEGFLALAASPVIFFLILFLGVFIPGRARRIRMKRESQSDSRYR